MGIVLTKLVRRRSFLDVVAALVSAGVAGSAAWTIAQRVHCAPAVTDYASPQEMASYIIFVDSTDNDKVKAKNGTTGKIEFIGTDAAVIIQSAMNALPTVTWKWWRDGVHYDTTSRTGTIVLMGDLNLRSPVTFTGSLFNLRLMGVGAKLNVMHTGDGLAFNLDRSRHITFENLAIYGNRFGGTGDNINIFGTDQVENVRFIGCSIQEAGRDGVHFESQSSITNHNWWEVNDCVLGDYAVVDSSVDPCVRVGNGRHDWYSIDLHHLNVVGNHFEGSGGSSLYLDNPHRQVQVVGNEFSYGGWNSSLEFWSERQGIRFAGGTALEVSANNFENRDIILAVGNTEGDTEDVAIVGNTAIGGPCMSWLARVKRFTFSNNVIQSTAKGWQTLLTLDHPENFGSPSSWGSIVGNEFAAGLLDNVVRFGSNLQIIGNRLPSATTPISLDDFSSSRIEGNAGFNPRPVTSITVGASPFTYTNNNGYTEEVQVVGGTINDIAIVRDGVETSLGIASGMLLLGPGDAIRVTYTSVPSMRTIPH